MIISLANHNGGVGKTTAAVKFLINRKIPGTRSGREIRQAFHKFNTGIIDTELWQRVAYADAMKYGVSVMQFAPGSKAAHEIEQFCDEIVSGVGQAAVVEQDQLDPIRGLYQEETENILFRSFKTVKVQQRVPITDKARGPARK